MADETKDKVLSIVADIVNKRVPDNETVSKEAVKENGDSKNITTTAAIRGQPKSGRFWKSQKEK